MKNLSETLQLTLSKKTHNVHKSHEQKSLSKEREKSDKNSPIISKHKKAPSLFFFRKTKKNRLEINFRMSTIENNLDNSRAPMQFKEQRLKKEKHMKKMLLLSEFDVDELSRPNMIINSPTTEAMKNSINAIKGESKIHNIDNKFKIHKDKDTNQSSILINANNNTMKGKKPCARDGCTGNLFNDKLLIFGGDRHLMAFHDLFFLNIKNLI